MDDYEKMDLVEKVFKAVFKDSIAVLTKTIRSGSNTSNNIYVPKKYKGHPVTIIIWNKQEEETENENMGAVS